MEPMQLDVDRQDINTAEMRDVERPMSQNISAAAGGENDDDENFGIAYDIIWAFSLVRFGYLHLGGGQTRTNQV